MLVDHCLHSEQESGCFGEIRSNFGTKYEIKSPCMTASILISSFSHGWTPPDIQQMSQIYCTDLSFMLASNWIARVMGRNPKHTIWYQKCGHCVKKCQGSPCVFLSFILIQQNLHCINGDFNVTYRSHADDAMRCFPKLKVLLPPRYAHN